MPVDAQGPQWVTSAMGSCEQRHSRNQHNFVPDLPRPAATCLPGSGAPGSTVLGQERETTKPGSSSDLLGSSINPSIQIQ